MSVSDDSGSGSNEKKLPITESTNGSHHVPTVDVIGDHGAHVLDINQLGAEGQSLQVAKDGRTLLIPQPSTDPNDPLNWSPTKKHVILAVIAYVSFVPDFGSSMGVVTLLPQAK